MQHTDSTVSIYLPSGKAKKSSMEDSQYKLDKGFLRAAELTGFCEGYSSKTSSFWHLFLTVLTENWIKIIIEK